MYKNLFLILLVAIIATSCSSVDVAKNFNHTQTELNSNYKAIAHINAVNTSYYFLGFLPMASGSSKNVGSVVFFSDDAKVSDVSEMLIKESKSMGADGITNMSTETDSTGAAFFWILYRKTTQASGDAVKVLK